MDKKSKKKGVGKRKSDEPAEGDSSKKKIMVRKNESEKEKVEIVSQVVEVPVEQGQQIVHAGQIVEGNYEQPLGPNTVILYEQNGNPSQFAFGGMWTMDNSGRIVMAETIYDVKGEPEEEGGNFVQNNAEVSTEGQQEYEVAIIENPPSESERAAARAAAVLCADTARRDDTAPLSRHDIAARCKTYALALLRADHTPGQLQADNYTNILHKVHGTGAGTLRLWDLLTRPGGAVIKLDSWLEADNYTNILHKVHGTGAGTLRLWDLLTRPGGAVIKLASWLEADNYTNILNKVHGTGAGTLRLWDLLTRPGGAGLERLLAKFQVSLRSEMQPDEFVSLLFSVVSQLEDERRIFAVTRLRYAYNLMSHQTKLAQKCLDDRGGRRHSSAAICKYGTSTQECSCLFSKVFKLPCRHILMLTTELKVTSLYQLSERVNE
ncbi:putative SOF1 protein [Operophtera brumata]|uniref:Putative SOF1 protein n=1 Tax=Operophtera brumata TaxID=104452 RepID=A0A0L7LAU2_OPEBR|nr:putative SOF1 protein [Operophtera brumata]